MTHFYELSKASKQQCEAQAVHSTFMQLGSTRQSVSFERLQPRHWLETFKNGFVNHGSHSRCSTPRDLVDPVKRLASVLQALARGLAF